MDAEYVIHSAFELGQITALEMEALAHPAGGYDQVRHYVDHNLQMDNDFLHNTARAALRSSPGLTYACAMRAAPAVQDGLKFMEDICMHTVRRAVLENLELSRPNDFLVLLGQGEMPRYFNQPEDVTEASVRQVLNAQNGGLLQRWEEDLRLIRAALTWAAEQTPQELQDGFVRQPVRQPEAQAPGLAELIQGWKQQASQRDRKLLKAEKQSRSKARAAVKKVSRLFEQMGYRDNLSLFVSGQAVELSHPDSPFKFSLKPLPEQGWLMSRTQKGRHFTPYDLQLLTKSDVHIARLCVYFDETPVLDQVLALSMFIHSGNEEELLLKANWFARNSLPEEEEQALASAFPALKSKLNPQSLVLREEDVAHQQVRLPVRILEEAAHWEPYAGRVQQWIRGWNEQVRLSLLGLTQEIEPLRLAFNAMMQPQNQPAPLLLEAVA